MFKLDLEKSEEPEIKLPISAESSKKQESSRETSTSAFFTMPKPLTVWITTNRKILKEMGILTLPGSCEIKKQQLEPDMEQQIVSKLGKEYITGVYCYLAYLTYMQNTSCEMPGWMKHKLESRLPAEIPITSDMQMMPPLW